MANWRNPNDDFDLTQTRRLAWYRRFWLWLRGKQAMTPIEAVTQAMR